MEGYFPAPIFLSFFQLVGGLISGCGSENPTRHRIIRIWFTEPAGTRVPAPMPLTWLSKVRRTSFRPPSLRLPLTRDCR